MILICHLLDLVTCVWVLLAGGCREAATARPRRVSQGQECQRCHIPVELQAFRMTQADHYASDPPASAPFVICSPHA